MQFIMYWQLVIFGWAGALLFNPLGSTQPFMLFMIMVLCLTQATPRSELKQQDHFFKEVKDGRRDETFPGVFNIIWGISYAGVMAVSLMSHLFPDHTAWYLGLACATAVYAMYSLKAVYVMTTVDTPFDVGQMWFNIFMTGVTLAGMFITYYYHYPWLTMIIGLTACTTAVWLNLRAERYVTSNT